MRVTSRIATRAAMMQEWFRLQAEGALTGPPALWMRTARPAEKLARETEAIRTRPMISSADAGHRVNARADAEGRQRLDVAVGRSGVGERAQMIQRMWPGGVQPDTVTLHLFRRETDVQSLLRDDGHHAADGSRDLRADAGRVDRLHDRGRPESTLAPLHRSDSRRQADDPSRQGHPVWIQGKRRDAAGADDGPIEPGTLNREP